MKHHAVSHRLTVLAVGLLSVSLLAAGALSGCTSTGTNTKKDEKPAAEAEPFEFSDSDKLPIGDSPTLGPEDARVTIVEFGDFQCPFCAKGSERLTKLRENFGEDVRIVFKHFPLPFHQEAKAAARAALAAGEQGKFWEMHDLLYDRQNMFRSGNMKKLASQWAGNMGLDVAQFKQDYDSDKWKKRIERDKAMGKKLGVRGTPSYFVNGEKLVGAQPYPKFEQVVSRRLAQADKLLEGQAEPGTLYKKAVAANYGKDVDSRRDRDDEKIRDDSIQHIPVDEDDPVRGAREDYLVTFVAFSDFQCPFCSKVAPRMQKLEENFGDRVRFVFKHRPLGFHQHAERAARASIAAQMQGKFWAMHDLIFDHQDRLGQTGLYADLADRLGLDVARFKTDMRSREAEERIDRDIDQADEAGANGTPNIFINGIQMVGAQPYSRFEQIIEKQLALAGEIEDEQGPMDGETLYKRVVKANANGEQPERDPTRRRDERAEVVDRSKFEIGKSPTKGPADAAVTIFEFSDFQCPYCAKARKTLYQKVLKDPKYKGKVRVVHKNFPLAFHNDARSAARAAMAAQRQGKFWEMYEKLFANQKSLGQKAYETYAKQLGLNLSTFKSDMKDKALDKRIQRDMKMGKQVGVRGTPSFFVNGRRLVGDQPAKKFEEAIDWALKHQH